jgi:hypothetical protein
VAAAVAMAVAAASAPSSEAAPADPALLAAGVDTLMKVVTGQLPAPQVAVAMPKVRGVVWLVVVGLVG